METFPAFFLLPQQRRLPSVKGTWYLMRTLNGFAAVRFGLPADRPVQADYDGDEHTELAVYRGNWYITSSLVGGLVTFQFGLGTDIPVPADYDGDGFVDYSTLKFGVAGDCPRPAAYQP